MSTSTMSMVSTGGQVKSNKQLYRRVDRSGTVNSQLRSETVSSQLRSGQSTVKSDLDSKQSTQIWRRKFRFDNVNSEMAVASDLSHSFRNSQKNIPVNSYEKILRKLYHSAIRSVPDLVFQISSELRIVSATLNHQKLQETH
ncbi:hypothetical protein F511_43571 [Dorcoceras hygrometricum]|uniref:Uncharacterized protein n=1 Tax=Dorcoceras hygrometricum TaxID=472368 RepID=A0A2Z6ZYL6_9LAMI|nr:hypothetical protein F511_43571 [Dorcoceras hygrometricum]